MGWLRVKRWHAADTLKNVFAGIDDVVHHRHGHDGHRQQSRHDRIARTADDVEAFAAALRTKRVMRKHQFADVEALGRRFGHVGGASNAGSSSLEAMQNFRRQLEGDIALLARRAEWDEAINRFLHSSKGNDNTEASLAGLISCLCEQIAIAEPPAAPHAIAVLLREQPSGNGQAGPAHATLQVHHATEASELEAGSSLTYASVADLEGAAAAPHIADTPTALASECWSVLLSGDAILRNGHGISGAGARSVVPLKDGKGSTYGVIVSGPPAVPDQLLVSMAKHAGWLIERAWKLERAYQMMHVVERFVRGAAALMDRLLYVAFTPRAARSSASDDAARDATPLSLASDSGWADWQPLPYTSASQPNRFELDLQWRRGEVVGVLSVECGTFTEMDEHVLCELHTVAILVQRAIEQIEDMEAS